MNDIQGVIMILAVLLGVYLLARTIFLMVYRLVRKKPWVGKALWWTTVLCGVAALFGPRNGSIISSVAVLGMILLLLGKVRWVKPSEDDSQEDYSSNRYSESYEEAMGTRKWYYW